MAKPARGLPDSFELNLPDEPVRIGDFLDEEPPVIPTKRVAPKVLPQPAVERFVPAEEISPKTARTEVGERSPIRVVAKAQQPAIIRYQLNLTPKAKTMLEELVEHVRTYSPQNDASVSEVFQGIIQVLHNAIGDLELSELPRRGAWGSVTAKNFPGALSEVFEEAILRAARRSG